MKNFEDFIEKMKKNAPDPIVRHSIQPLCHAYRLSPYNKASPTTFDKGKTFPWSIRERYLDRVWLKPMTFSHGKITTHTEFSQLAF